MEIVPNDMDWQQVKAEFEWDGSLRDLYVLETDRAVWQKALDFLRASSYPLSYLEGGEDAELPAEVAPIFIKRLEVGALLSVDVQGININCHFFVEEQIEFDIDPREVNNAARFDHLCGFIRRLGQGLGRNVILTPETSGNEQDEVIIRYLPMGDQFEYTPVGIP